MMLRRGTTILRMLRATVTVKQRGGMICLAMCLMRCRRDMFVLRRARRGLPAEARREDGGQHDQ